MRIDEDAICALFADAERDLAYALAEYNACWCARPIDLGQVSAARAEVLAAGEVMRLAHWIGEQWSEGGQG
jgi:hypothetical protein